MTTTTAPRTNAAGLYIVDLLVGNAGTPGAPTLDLGLAVNASTGAVTGQGKIKQAVQSPGNEITVQHLTGQVHFTGLGKATKIVALHGEAIITPAPPLVMPYVLQISISLAVDNDWNGTGGWVLGGDQVSDLPVKNTSPSVD